MNQVTRISNYFSPERMSPEKFPEDSTLLKIVSCIPVLGLIVHYSQHTSVRNRLKSLPMPEEFRPNSRLGAILPNDAKDAQVKASLEKAVDLTYIQRDSLKTSIVRDLFTVALAIYALSISVIPMAVAGLVITGSIITVSFSTFLLCSKSPISDYQAKIAEITKKQ